MANLNIDPNQLLASLKDLDVNKIKDLLSEHRVKVVSACVVIASLFGLSMIWGHYQEEKQNYDQQLLEMDQKKEAVDKYKISKKALETYLAALKKPLLDKDLIPQLTSFAEERHVSINNYVPSPKKNEKAFDSLQVRLNINADDFKDLLAFLYAIERSKYLLRVDSLSFGNKGESGVLSGEVSISSLVKK